MATIIGTNNSETIDAADGVTNSADTIYGLGGNDTIYGLGGNDKIKGGGGADTIYGGSGIDTAYYSDSDAPVSVALWAGTGSGGTAQGDALIGIENLWGSSFGDVLTGDTGVNVLTGNGGDDELFGGTGNDVLDGGDGSDTIAYANNAQGLNVNLVTGIATTSGAEADTDQLISIENVTGTWNADVMIGNDADNRFVGFEGLDIFHGGGGNDFLWGGFAGDVLDGGSGTDTAYYGDSYAAVIINLMAGTADGGDASGDTLTSIENVVGSSYDDTLMGDNGGNELYGQYGNDTLKGGGGADKLYGDVGNDFLAGGTGDDGMYGGYGDDSFNVDSANDTVFENVGEGTDTVYASVSYTLATGQSIEILKTSVPSATIAIDLTGNEIANTIYGNAGANTIDGGLGADTMLGGLGNDIYYVNTELDTVTEKFGGGTDTVNASASFTLSADVENLTLLGGAGAISGTGNSLNNVIVGNDSVNMIAGGDGNDTLTGGVGVDEDIFVFNTALNAATNVDTIVDFNDANDTFNLDDAVFNGLALGTLAATQFHIGAAASQLSDRIIYDQATGALFFDADGDLAGAAVKFAQVIAGQSLSNADFVIV